MPTSIWQIIWVSGKARHQTIANVGTVVTWRMLPLSKEIQIKLKISVLAKQNILKFHLNP